MAPHEAEYDRREEDKRCDDEDWHAEAGGFRFTGFGWHLGEHAAGIETKLDVAESASPRRIGPETLPCNFREGLRDGCRHHRFFVLRFIPNRGLLGESFDQCDAEGPDITCRRDGAGGGFWSGVDALWNAAAKVPGSVKAVGRKLHLVIYDQDVRRLEVTVHEAFGVEIGERVEDGVEHLPYLSGCERPLRKYLRQIFIGIFRDGVENADAVDLAVSDVKEAHQVRMRKGGRSRPTSAMGFSIRGVGRNELDRGFLLLILQLGKEDTTPLRAA